MSTRYHIGRNGEPARCNAKSEDSCPLKREGSIHGTREEIFKISEEANHSADLRTREIEDNLSPEVLNKLQDIAVKDYIKTGELLPKKYDMEKWVHPSERFVGDEINEYLAKGNIDFMGTEKSDRLDGLYVEAIEEISKEHMGGHPDDWSLHGEGYAVSKFVTDSHHSVYDLVAMKTEATVEVELNTEEMGLTPVYSGNNNGYRGIHTPFMDNNDIEYTRDNREGVRKLFEEYCNRARQISGREDWSDEDQIRDMKVYVQKHGPLYDFRPDRPEMRIYHGTIVAELPNGERLTPFTLDGNVRIDKREGAKGIFRQVEDDGARG